MQRTESGFIEICWISIHKNQLFLSDTHIVEHHLSNLEQFTVLLWHQLFQEKNLSRPLEAGWVSKKLLMWAFPYHPYTHVVFMASQIPVLPKIMERHTLQKIEAYTTCDNFPLNTSWSCNAILMYCFCNRVRMPFSRLLNRWKSHIYVLSS